MFFSLLMNKARSPISTTIILKNLGHLTQHPAIYPPFLSTKNPCSSRGFFPVFCLGGLEDIVLDWWILRWDSLQKAGLPGRDHRPKIPMPEMGKRHGTISQGNGTGIFIYTWYAKQPFFNGCLVKQPFFYVMIWNHPIETTIWNRLFGVPSSNYIFTINWW